MFGENFCNYCQCTDCKFGTIGMVHALTSNNDWICDVCYMYDLCTSGPFRNKNGPCDDELCQHRPILNSEWIEF